MVCILNFWPFGQPTLGRKCGLSNDLHFEGNVAPWTSWVLSETQVLGRLVFASSEETKPLVDPHFEFF